MPALPTRVPSRLSSLSAACPPQSGDARIRDLRIRKVERAELRQLGEGLHALVADRRRAKIDIDEVLVLRQAFRSTVADRIPPQIYAAEVSQGGQGEDVVRVDLGRAAFDAERAVHCTGLDVATEASQFVQDSFISWAAAASALLVSLGQKGPRRHWAPDSASAAHRERRRTRHESSAVVLRKLSVLRLGRNWHECNDADQRLGCEFHVVVPSSHLGNAHETKTG